MTRRTKIIIAAVVVLLMAVLLALLLFRQTPEVLVIANNQPGPTNLVTGLPTTDTNQPEETGTPMTPVVTPTPTTPQPAVPTTDDSASMKRLAAAFAERFGSFSNQSNFDNVTDLKVFMTARMQAWADTYTEEQRAKGTSTVYSGTTTRAISSTMTVFDDAAGMATIIVGTQRRETKADGSTRIYYQDLELSFLKQGTEWKIDAAFWK